MNAKKIKTRIRRDWIDALRTVVWYAYIETHFFNRTNYEIAKLIEPEVFGIDEDKDINNQIRWAKYRRGIHTPGQDLINKANMHVEGTANIINHVLWEAIRGRKSMKWFMNDGVSQLSWDVQKIIFKSVNGQKELISVFHITRNVRKLQRLASFDALAALIIFFRIAVDQNQKETASRVALSIYRISLVMCVYSPFPNFKYGLAFLLYLNVFSILPGKRRNFDSSDVDEFCERSFDLNAILLIAEDECFFDLKQKDNRKKSYSNYLFDTLEGKHNFRMLFEFAPSF